MRKLINLLGFILTAGISVALVWSFLYLCIPGVKTETDKLFKWNTEVVEDEVSITEVPDTHSQFVFENDNAKITLG